MSTPGQRLADLGLELPEVVAPLAAYVPVTRSGNLLFTAGQLPLRDGALVATGRLGDGVSTEQGADCARQCALNALAALVTETGSLDAVGRVVKVVVYVAATADFAEHPAVANGASELLGEVFGPGGRHARSAVGVASLPLGAPVEVELVVEA